MAPARKVLRISDLTRQFNKFLDSNGRLQEYSSVAREYAGGNLYLGGGTVYGNLANTDYEGDADFLGEFSIKGKSLERDDEWIGRYTRRGTIFFERIRNGIAEVIDIDYLSNLMKDLVSPTIQDYVKRRTNFIYDVQNVVYDLKNRKIIAGNAGIRSLSRRMLRFHSLNVAIVIAEKKLLEEFSTRNITPEIIIEKLEELMKEKADKIDFGYRMPSKRTLEETISRRHT